MRAPPLDLRLRPARAPFSLEKWYLDVLLDDGTVLLVYLGQMFVLGRPLRRVTVDLFLPDGTHRRGDAPVPAVEATADRITFGPAVLEAEGRLRFDTPGLSGELRYRPRHPPVTLRDPFFRAGSRSLTWHVEIPDADVEGQLTWPGGGMAVTGRGYRDRVHFDLLPWRFPLRTLRWGRAVGGDHATTWTRATLARGEVSVGWRDGRVLDGAEPATPAAERVMLETHVVDLDGLKLGALRPVLRPLVGDPHEIKWAAATTLGGAPARMVHEVVRWR